MVKTTSQKQYLSTYLSLIKKAESSDIKDIYDYIFKKKVKDNTKASYLNSIISLKKIDDKSVKGNLKDIIEYRDKLNNKIEKDREIDNIREGQKEAIQNINLDDLRKFGKELNLKKNNSLKDLEDAILINMMVMYPLRNDLQEILLTQHKKDLTKPDLNILFIPKKGECVLSLKEFKTSSSQGEIIININIELSDDIRNLIKSDTFRKYLFENRFNKPLSSSSFTHKLNVLTKKEFGIPISSTLIRKIYLSSKYANTIKDMKKDSQILGHSLDTQRSTYINNN